MDLFKCTGCGEVVDIESGDVYYDGDEDVWCLSCHFDEGDDEDF